MNRAYEAEECGRVIEKKRARCCLVARQSKMDGGWWIVVMAKMDGERDSRE
jgi:hypothetical protein